MRAMKFRGKIDGKWWYVRVNDEHISSSWESFWILADKRTIGQCIPYTDKNDNPIFEGDIVATGLGENYVKGIVSIGEASTYADTYDNSIEKPYYGVYLENMIDLEEILLSGGMYVLGNVYDDPGLVNSKGNAT